jgi:anti-anti-sigma factor
MNNSSEIFILSVTNKNGFVVLTPQTRELTFKNSKQFLTEAKKTVCETKTKVVLCLENIEIIDSMSLGTLMAFLKYIRKLGGDVVVCNLSEPIRELFKLLNFNTVFRCFKTIDEAIAKY